MLFYTITVISVVSFVFAFGAYICERMEQGE